jgi:hypothetical protein
MTQGTNSFNKQIQVAGAQATIVLESLDGRSEIEAGATTATSPGEAPAIHDCNGYRTGTVLGSTSPRKTHVLVRVLDAAGTPLTGVLVDWHKPPGLIHSPLASFETSPLPQGGVAFPNVATLDLGAFGAGAVQTICGGGTAGSLNVVTRFSGVLNGFGPESYTQPYSIPVVGVAPSPTATPVACTNDFDCDGVIESIDNCPSVANVDQKNNDGNFIDNSPPYAVVTDDRTRINSDRDGDACDVDDDNDGLYDIDEMSGSTCFAASGPTDPFNDDTDGDRYLDGAECSNQFDPLSGGTSPALTDCGPSDDQDGDMLSTRAEFCLYGGLYAYYETDYDRDQETDGAWDLCEVASLNGDRVVNSGDQGMLARAVAGLVPYLRNIDINRDGMINSGDQGMQAMAVRRDFCPLAPPIGF